jgi:mono/diheme cytochrome c family protein
MTHGMSKHRRWLTALATLLAAVTLAALAVFWLDGRGESPLRPDAPGTASPADAAAVARGAYLARAGNCAACHTARGGAPYAGGRAIATPFGTVYAGNLTPDAASGLGRWTADEFWRALYHGRSRDGRALLPAFPYPQYTQVTRADADDLLAWLRSLPPVAQANRPHALRWPYDTAAALAVWRALYFRPGSFRPDNGQSAEWNRGAYLVNGLGHCSACHGHRNLLGASTALTDGPGGASLPGQRWVAPSLTDPAEAGSRPEDAAALLQLLRTGLSDHAAVMGPMAEVVAQSTQHLSETDLRAMVRYLVQITALPAASAASAAPARLAARPASTMARGAQLYTRHCADCHGNQGQGAPGIYPALAGNRSVTMANPGNLLQAITGGGFPPATAGNPRPYGMPAYDLPPDELAALATWLRSSWGHDAPAVSAVQALLAR